MKISVGGCKICDQDFLTHRHLLLHLRRHCDDVFYLTEQGVCEDYSEEIGRSAESFIHVDELLSTPDPTTSPEEVTPLDIERDVEPIIKLEKCDSPKLVSKISDKRPTMVHLAETADRLNYFICSECNQTFDRAEIYNDHLNIHIKVAGTMSNRPETDGNVYQDFKCIDCDDRSFADVNQYHDHLKISHGAETLSCTICEQQFGTKFELNRHMGAHNGGSHECPDCGSCFRVKKHLVRHIFDHNSSQNVVDDANSSPERSPSMDETGVNVDTQEACTSNDYLDELLAFTVSNRPKRLRLGRLRNTSDQQPNPTKSGRIEFDSGQNSRRNRSELNLSDANLSPDSDRIEEKLNTSNYFLELVQTNVCKYKNKNVANFGEFNCYLTKCMDTASTDKISS